MSNMTEQEAKDFYGADAAEWLQRWDDGRSVWSIEMGGLGPGYEQAIQVTAAEIVRMLLSSKVDHSAWSDQEKWERDRALIEKQGFENATIKALGLTGAQWGAALSIATKLYMDGPSKVLTDPRVEDRHIQVQRTFPSV